MGASCNCEKGPSEKGVIHATSSCCSNIQNAKEDSKGMVNQRLLAACRDNNIGALKLVLEEAPYLETRRPFIMRPKPPSGLGGLNDAGLNGKRRKGPKEGLTPLMYSSQNGSVAGTHLLLEAKAQVMARDEDGLRPLHFAATSGVLEVCKMLLLNGADSNAMDDEGRRAIDYVPRGSLRTEAEREAWEALLGPQLAAPPEASSDAPLLAPPKAVEGKKASLGAQNVLPGNAQESPASADPLWPNRPVPSAPGPTDSSPTAEQAAPHGTSGADLLSILLSAAEELKPTASGDAVPSTESSSLLDAAPSIQVPAALPAMAAEVPEKQASDASADLLSLAPPKALKAMPDEPQEPEETDLLDLLSDGTMKK
eukprot:TRINITY_DN16254_c0_g1_i3.p1 TRINITY_DN16254_c0_g1~~TRINITY_DN16254_c0_g1_i3.p1  ORF type:complete len:368 (-),score=101.14 TRINITY_DN16254_c0_g1_i3:21-1124(-)